MPDVANASDGEYLEDVLERLNAQLVADYERRAKEISRKKVTDRPAVPLHLSLISDTSEQQYGYSAGSVFRHSP